MCKVWFGDLSDRSFHTEFPSQVIYTSEQLFSFSNADSVKRNLT
ncbi:hypothetical protein EDC91_1421 [Shewanella fodinae]|uniref:Uncharacterized protein n=1 Tax=Shewanella fodinae TaxID=552357 RepID=A0A4R2F657_9GAMM|nr:hypothetical protein EDC91_1421 [Shewanella fodinae]